MAPTQFGVGAGIPRPIAWIIDLGGNTRPYNAGLILPRRVGAAWRSEKAGEKCFVDKRESVGRSIFVTGNNINRDCNLLSLAPKRVRISFCGPLQ